MTHPRQNEVFIVGLHNQGFSELELILSVDNGLDVNHPDGLPLDAEQFLHQIFEVSYLMPLW